jgi:hypothetical protein
VVGEEEEFALVKESADDGVVEDWPIFLTGDAPTPFLPATVLDFEPGAFVEEELPPFKSFCFVS